MPMRRLIFLNRFFLPDHSATSQLLGDLATHLAASGREVHVITSQQLYDDSKACLPARKMIGGVHVHRIPTSSFGRSNLFGRGFDYVCFYASAWSTLRALVMRDDLIIAMTDPPVVSIVAMGVARLRGALLINWLQDIYPEVAVELGVPFLKGPVARQLARLRDRCLKAAVANVVVGERMAERVAAREAPVDVSMLSQTGPMMTPFIRLRPATTICEASGSSKINSLSAIREILDGLTNMIQS